MFERFTEAARRALFFARYAVAERGGAAIEPEHIVLGVMQVIPEAISRFASIDDAVNVITSGLIGNFPHGLTLPTSTEIPFSAGTKQALERAVIEADDLRDTTIRPEHLILGVLVKTSGDACDALNRAGVKISTIRQFLRPAQA